LPNVHEKPQETANETDYRVALAKASLSRDKALVAVLSSSGMRRAEVARMRIEDLDLDNGAVVVPITKTGAFRTAPLSPECCKLLRVHHGASPAATAPVSEDSTAYAT
jgi:integrase